MGKNIDIVQVIFTASFNENQAHVLTSKEICGCNISECYEVRETRDYYRLFHEDTNVQYQAINKKDINTIREVENGLAYICYQVILINPTNEEISEWKINLFEVGEKVLHDELEQTKTFIKTLAKCKDKFLNSNFLKER